MKNARNTLLLAMLPCLAFPLRAVEPEPPSMGAQLRLSLPKAGLGDAVGSTGLQRPGLGGSFLVELDTTEGFWIRGEMGADYWRAGEWIGRPGFEGQVSNYFLAIEGVLMLGPQASPRQGPYVVGGVARCGWSVSTHNKLDGTSESQHLLKTAFIFGVGYHLNANWDLELRGMGGSIRSDLSGAAVLLGVNFRFR